MRDTTQTALGPGMPVLLQIVVPAFNEEKRLPDSLDALCRKTASLPVGAEILVVDNASTDSTPDIVRGWPRGEVPVRLLHCAQRGKGAAVRAGLLASRAPFVGFCDADMATDLSALDYALELLLGGSLVVIGSRAHEQSVVEERHSRLRGAGAAVFRGLSRLVVPGATDTQCGFKFFYGPIARAAAEALRSTGFAFDIELLARCRRLGAAAHEIPVHWRDIPGSTFSVQRHAVAALLETAAIWMRMRAATGEPAHRPAGEPLPGPDGQMRLAHVRPVVGAEIALEAVSAASPGAAAAPAPVSGGHQSLT